MRLERGLSTRASYGAGAGKACSMQSRWHPQGAAADMQALVERHHRAATKYSKAQRKFLCEFVGEEVPAAREAHVVLVHLNPVMKL